MKLTCVFCGITSTKYDQEGQLLMGVSQSSGRAYCVSERACNSRRDRRIKSERRRSKA